MSKFSGLMALLPLLGLTACGVGQAVHGSAQSVRLDVHPRTAAGVSCLAENERGSYTVPDVPMHVQVNRARGPLSVRCRSFDGMTGSAIVQSYGEPFSGGNFAVAPVAGAGTAVVGATTAVFGTGAMTAGPAIGVGLGAAGIAGVQDYRSGGMWGYPSTIVVPMAYINPPVESAVGGPLTAPPRMERVRSRPVRHIHAPVRRAVGAPTK